MTFCLQSETFINSKLSLAFLPFEFIRSIERFKSIKSSQIASKHILIEFFYIPVHTCLHLLIHKQSFRSSKSELIESLLMKSSWYLMYTSHIRLLRTHLHLFIHFLVHPFTHPRTHVNFARNQTKTNKQKKKNGNNNENHIW